MTLSAEPDIQETPSYDLGVLFVHGIGDQPRGSTLVGFGTPLVEWLAGRAEHVGGHATVVDARLAPRSEGEPAHAELRIESEGTARRWLMAEAWWAESFRVPRFADLARWAGAVVPWTFGSHFGVRLMRAWRGHPEQGQGLRWFGGVANAVLSLLGGMVLSLIMLVALALLLVLGLIPWERLRTAIARFQLRMASSVGDSYVLVTRPIESAAILSRFGCDLAWLERRCLRVAVVAHSQGGAVACRALEALPAREGRLLVTLGSGLRKLEELEELRGRPGVRRGAALAVGGLALVGICGVWALFRHQRASWLDVAALLLYAAFGLAVFIGGIRDFVGEPEPGRLRKLCETLGKRVAGWTDLYASGDPVSNGCLHVHGDLPPVSVRVVNLGSMLRDHTAYWDNRDEFVTQAVDILLEFDAALPRLRLDSDRRKVLQARRRARVSLLRTAWWTALASALLLVIRFHEEWSAIVGWLGLGSVAWMAGRVGGSVEVAPSPDASSWGHTVGWLALIVLAYAVARYLWSIWNGEEMKQFQPGPRQEVYETAFMFTIALQVAVAGIAVSGAASLWVMYCVVIAALGFAMAAFIKSGVLKPPVGFFLDQASTETNAPYASRVAGWGFRVYRTLAMLAIGLILLAWAVTWVGKSQQFLARQFAWQPGWVVSGALLVIGVMAGLMLVSYGLVRAGLFFWKRKAGAGDGGPPPSE